VLTVGYEDDLGSRPRIEVSCSPLHLPMRCDDGPPIPFVVSTLSPAAGFAAEARLSGDSGIPRVAGAGTRGRPSSDLHPSEFHSRLAPTLMASARMVVLNRKDRIVCASATRRILGEAIVTSEVCEAAPIVKET
jgi:hypothetical protein